jgi:hypothetical protein
MGAKFAWLRPTTLSILFWFFVVLALGQTRSDRFLVFRRLIWIFVWISYFKFELSIKFWIKWILKWPSLYLFQKNTDQNTQKTRFDRSDRSGIGFWSVLFWNKYNNGHSSIHFIQNLMLNLNLKSDIQKYIWVKRLKTKRGQTEFEFECQH